MTRLFRILALAAILSLACMPTGYMPDREEDGTLVLRICSGMAAEDRSVSVGMDHGSQHAGDDQHHGMAEQKPCDYAVAAVADLPPTIDLASAPVEARRVEPDDRHPLTGLFPRGLPPATGPPAA